MPIENAPSPPSVTCAAVTVACRGERRGNAASSNRTARSAMCISLPRHLTRVRSPPLSCLPCSISPKAVGSSSMESKPLSGVTPPHGMPTRGGLSGSKRITRMADNQQ